MKKLTSYLAAFSFAMICATGYGQERGIEQTTSLFKKITKERGQLYGSVVVDAAYKVNADSVANRNEGTQYAKLPVNSGQVSLKRVLLGYNYEINNRFGVEFLAAAEDNSFIPFTATTKNVVLQNQFNPYIRVASLRYNNVFYNSDLVIGQIYTPAFAGNSEKLWGYRNIEKTVSEMYGTAASSFGVSLQGYLPEDENFGYNLMVANGSGAGPLNIANKALYGEVFYRFFGQRLTIDLYADYTKLNASQRIEHSHQMNKVIIAYCVPRFTLGVEAFTNTLKGDNIATRQLESLPDTIATKCLAYSVFMKARIIGKKLGIFARYDNFTAGLNNNDALYSGYNNQNYYYNPKVARQFVTFGLDIRPTKHLHIMPNVWYSEYRNNSTKLGVKENMGFDLVYRLTASYNFGR